MPRKPRVSFPDFMVLVPSIVRILHYRWCGPCQLLAPLLEKGVQETAAGRVDLARVDVDQLSELALEYEVKFSSRCYLVYYKHSTSFR